ncbi:MAG: glycosyltransferase [Proteobacteria bacterium]|nr:glycosyltransferase [Pseudomonadota bacterium]
MRVPPVTVIIPTCNRAHFIGETLDSVLGQTVPPAQVIVVNDGSTDATLEVLARYGDRIEVIDQANSGRPRAVNRALPEVRGEYLWVFDDDDLAVPQSLERHLAVLEADPSVDFTYAGCIILQTHPDGRTEQKGPLPMPEVSDDETFSRLLEQNFMQLQAMLVRTRCHRAVGPFNDRLNLCDDYDMILRLGRRFTGRRLDAPTFLFRQHAGLRGRPGALFPAEHRSRYWVLENRDIHLRLREQLRLGEYLPRSLGAGDLDGANRRRALLQRACVMARLALWPEALADLEDALVDTLPGVPLTALERDLCRRALGRFIRFDLAIEGLVDDDATGRRFADILAGSRNDDARRAFGGELARYGRARLRAREVRRGLRALALARRIGGVGRLFDR